jgi:hypothetical protein
VAAANPTAGRWLRRAVPAVQGTLDPEVGARPPGRRLNRSTTTRSLHRLVHRVASSSVSGPTDRDPGVINTDQDQSTLSIRERNRRVLHLFDRSPRPELDKSDSPENSPLNSAALIDSRGTV